MRLPTSVDKLSILSFSKIYLDKPYLKIHLHLVSFNLSKTID